MADPADLDLIEFDARQAYEDAAASEGIDLPWSAVSDDTRRFFRALVRNPYQFARAPR